MDNKAERDVIAAGIRMARAKRRWSQPTLADRANLTKQTIINVEAGKSVYASTLFRIADAFGLSVRDLLELGGQAEATRSDGLGA